VWYGYGCIGRFFVVEKEMQKRGTKVYPFTQEDMYNTWVQCQRNASEAARQLNMHPQTMYYHVRTHKFHERYEAEFTSAASSIRRIAMVDASNKMGDMIQVLYDIAHDPELNVMARVKAVETFFSIFPKEQPIVEDAPRYIEATARLIPAAELTGETEVSEELIEKQVMEALEGNVQNTSPSRK